MENKPLYKALAQYVTAWCNCIASNNTEWRDKHRERANALVREHMPSGAGFDDGVKLDWDRSSRERLVFCTSFHHMNENGYYDGWTEHTVTVVADFVSDFDMKISGRDRDCIKDHIDVAFDIALRTVV